MTWCDHCMSLDRLSDHYDHEHARIEHLCGPCWRWAIYWDSIAPVWRWAS